MPCSQVAVVAAERTSVVLVFSEKEEDSYHSPFSGVEESPAFCRCHCVFSLCFLNSICAALPCLVAACSQTGEQKMEAAPRGSEAVWDLHMQR